MVIFMCRLADSVGTLGTCKINLDDSAKWPEINPPILLDEVTIIQAVKDQITREYNRMGISSSRMETQTPGTLYCRMIKYSSSAARGQSLRWTAPAP